MAIRKQRKSPEASMDNMAKGTFRMFIAELLFLPSGMITAIYLARSLGPEGYGIVSLLSMLAVWVKNNANSVFINVSVKMTGETEDWQPVAALIVRLHFFLGIIVGAAYYFAAGIISEFLHEPSIISYLKIFSIDILMTSICYANGNILTGRGFFSEIALVKTIFLIARLFLIVLFVELGLSVTGAVMGLIGATAVQLAAGSWFARPTLFTNGVPPVRRMFDIGLPLFFSQLAFSMIGLHFFILKALGASADELGFFGAALNLSIPPGLFISSLLTTLYSTINRMESQGRMEEGVEMVGITMRIIFFLFPFAFMSAGLSSEIVAFIYGEKFLAAGPILAIMIFVPIVFFMIQLAKTAMIVTGRHYLTLALAFPLLALAFCGHFIFTADYHGTGAAGVTLATGCAGFLPACFILYRTLKVSVSFKSVFVSGIISAGAFYISNIWHTPGCLVILKIILVMAMIIAAFRISGEFSAKEISFLRQAVKRR